jgi:hypothetical protein
MDPDRYGLKRGDFTAAQQRALRQACGFGCVMCGKSLYDYAHVDPPFEDAKEHDIAKMALLCVEHHVLFDRYGRISAEQVLHARAAPAAMKDGFAHDMLHQGTEGDFRVLVGHDTFIGCRRILCIEGSDILRVDPPEATGGPHLLTALFCDAEGGLVVSIVRNHVLYMATSWDVEQSGPCVTIRERQRKVCLRMYIHPDSVYVEKVDTAWAGARVVLEDGQIRVIGTEGACGFFGNVWFDRPVCIGVREGKVLVGG